MLQKIFLVCLGLFIPVGCEKAGNIVDNDTREKSEQASPITVTEERLERKVEEELSDLFTEETDSQAVSESLSAKQHQLLKEALAKAVKDIDTSLLEASLPETAKGSLSSKGWKMKSGKVKTLTEEEAKELGIDSQLTDGNATSGTSIQVFSIGGENAENEDEIFKKLKDGELNSKNVIIKNTSGQGIQKEILDSLESGNSDDLVKQLSSLIQQGLDEAALQQLGVIEGNNAVDKESTNE